MALTCGNCGAKVELSDDDRRKLAGKFFACPECGTARRLKPVATAELTNQASAIPDVEESQPSRSRSIDGKDAKLRWRPSEIKVVDVETTGPKQTLFGNPWDKNAVVMIVVTIIGVTGILIGVQRSMLPNAFVWLTEPAMPPIAEPPAGKKPLLADPATDREALSAVRALFRRNLPTGKWQELQWWPTRTIVILTLGGQQPDGVDRRAKLMARMKFRTQNQSGAMEVYDFLFVVENDGVRVATDDVDFNHSILGKKMFDLGMMQITPSPERLLLDLMGGPRQWPPNE